MEKAIVEQKAAEAQQQLRAMAVAAGLMTETQAEEWIIVKAGELGKGRFKGINTPPVCTGCGKEHKHDEWVPLEIGISKMCPHPIRDHLIRLMQMGTGNVN